MEKTFEYENYGQIGSTTYLTRSEMEEFESLDQELDEFEREGEVSLAFPFAIGDTFTVLPTGASGLFKDWVWPLPIWNGRKPVISNEFNPKPGKQAGMTHPGADIMYKRLNNEMAKHPEGTKGFFVPSNRIPVFAVGKGVVAQIGKSTLGHSVIIDHRNGYYTFYQHLTAQGLPVKSAAVAAGTPIGIVGHGQETPINHLHFEIWPNRVREHAIDPSLVFNGMFKPSNMPISTPSVPISTSGPEAGILRQTIQRGVRDENHLTNMVFFARHPNRLGRKLMRGEPGFDALAKEWLLIRDHLVRPSLSAKSTPAPLMPSQVPASVQTSDLPTGRYGTLVVEAPAEYRFSYTFTPEDGLWLARLLKGEAGGRDDLNNHAVIWAMFHRFALFTHAGSYWMKRAGLRGYPTFSSFIQSYSTTLQPVLHSAKAAQRAIGMSKKDPRRFQYIETGGFYPGTTIPKGQLKHHRETIQKMTWSSLSQETRSLVERALNGRLKNPIGLASQFANTRTYFLQNNNRSPQNYDEWRNYTETFARSKKWTWIGPISGLDQVGQNAFFVDNRVKNLAPETVRVQP